MRLVLDTNTVVSGFLWNNAPSKLIAAAVEERIELASSEVLIAELTRVLQRGKFTARLTRQQLTPFDVVSRYQMLAHMASPARITPTVHADHDDDHVLACVLAAQVHLIVSGDTDLLNLKHYQRIPIVRATEALTVIEKLNPE